MHELLKMLSGSLKRDYIVGVTLLLASGVAYQTYALSMARKDMVDKVVQCETSKAKAIAQCESEKVEEMREQLLYLKNRVEKLDKLTKKRR